MEQQRLHMEVVHLKAVMVVTGVFSNGTTVQGYDFVTTAGLRANRCVFKRDHVQGYDFVTTAGLRALVSICSQGNSNRTGELTILRRSQSLRIRFTFSRAIPAMAARSLCPILC